MFYVYIIGLAVLNYIIYFFVTNFYNSVFILFLLFQGDLMAFYEVLLSMPFPISTYFFIFLIFQSIIVASIFKKRFQMRFPENKNIIQKIIFFSLLIALIHQGGVWIYDRNAPKVGHNFTEEQSVTIDENGKTILFEGSTGWLMEAINNQVLFRIHSKQRVHSTQGDSRGINIWDIFLFTLKSPTEGVITQVTDLPIGSSVHSSTFIDKNNIVYITTQPKNSQTELYQYNINTKVHTKKISENIVNLYNSLRYDNTCPVEDPYHFLDKDEGHHVYACTDKYIAFLIDRKWSVYSISDKTLIYESAVFAQAPSTPVRLRIFGEEVYYSIDKNRIVYVDLKTKNKKVVLEDEPILDWAVTEDMIVYKKGIDSWEYQSQIIVKQLP